MKVYITEKQFGHILKEEISLKTAEDKGAREQTYQADFPETVKCPHCGKESVFQFSVMDKDGKSKKQLGIVGKDGKWKETEFQAYGVYQCPYCYKSTALNNMA